MVSPGTGCQESRCFASDQGGKAFEAKGRELAGCQTARGQGLARRRDCSGRGGRGGADPKKQSFWGRPGPPCFHSLAVRSLSQGLSREAAKFNIVGKAEAYTAG